MIAKRYQLRMAQVLVRNLDDRVVETHRNRAAAKGRSLEAELREVLQSNARWTVDEKIAYIREMQARARAAMVPGVEQTPGWILIREDRDSDDR